jgi:hypothetical protein
VARLVSKICCCRAQDDEAELKQSIPSSAVADKRKLARVMFEAFVLDEDSIVGICEVDPGDERAGRIAYDVLRVGGIQPLTDEGGESVRSTVVQGIASTTVVSSVDSDRVSCTVNPSWRARCQ